jgi:hypothetical protein
MDRFSKVFDCLLARFGDCSLRVCIERQGLAGRPQGGDRVSTTDPTAELVADELARCRQRGLENLDGDAGRQHPVRAPELERLADLHAGRQDTAAISRILKIKIMLAAALDEYSVTEKEDASLIRNLLFSDSALTVGKSPGALLAGARRSLGEPSEALFRQRFKRSFSDFAEFLVHVVDAAAERNGAASLAGHEIGLGSFVQLTAGVFGGTPDRFVELLAESTEATVVGFSSELLESALRAALNLKRDRQKDSGAFWDSLEIVFLGEPLLDYLDDQAVSPDPRVALRERRLAMTKSLRAVRLFLRQTGCSGWAVSETPFMPMFTGSLFVMPDSRQVVQLTMRQPAARVADHVYLELEDLPGDYFTKAFRRVVDRSVTENRPVPVGIPFGSTFVCTETVWRDALLQPGSGRQDWLPIVLVVTTQRWCGRVTPVLQLRTEENAVRELDTVSHLSRHIYQYETSPLPGQMISAPPSFDAKSDCARRAAQLRIQTETGDDTPAAIRELPPGKYVNPDTDNLFFFVYSLELPEDMRLWPGSEMYHFSLDELIRIRAHQALRIAAAVCRITDRPARFWRTAVELAALNLALHDYGEVGERLKRVADGTAMAQAEVSADIETLIASAPPFRAASGREMQIVGLAGCQYREFYRVLVPHYAKVGVPGASEELRRIRKISTDHVENVFARLTSLYQDEDLLRSVPIEL